LEFLYDFYFSQFGLSHIKVVCYVIVNGPTYWHEKDPIVFVCVLLSES